MLDGALLPSYIHPSAAPRRTFIKTIRDPGTLPASSAREIIFVGTVAPSRRQITSPRTHCRFHATCQWALRADAVALTNPAAACRTPIFPRPQEYWKRWASNRGQLRPGARSRASRRCCLMFPEVDAIVCIGGNDTAWDLPPRADRVIAAVRDGGIINRPTPYRIAECFSACQSAGAQERAQRSTNESRIDGLSGLNGLNCLNDNRAGSSRSNRSSSSSRRTRRFKNR